METEEITVKANTMPAGRIILKSISESRKLSILKTDSARLLFTWLIPHLDKNGCFSGDAEVINGRIFTRLKKATEEVEKLLKDLEGVGLIKRYRVKEDVFLNVPDFKDKQPYLNPEREGKPKYPEPETTDLFKIKSAPSPDLIQGNPAKEKEKEKVKEKENIYGNEFDALWKIWPIKRDKEQAFLNYCRIRKTEELGVLEKAVMGYKAFLKNQRINKNFDQTPLYLSTFLNKNRWKEYLSEKYVPSL